MNLFEKYSQYVLALIAMSLLGACGGQNSDPVTKELNRHLDIDIDYLDIDRSNLYPGQTLDIEWRSQGAVLFDARVYLSTDRRISSDDIKVVDKACGLEHDDHCYEGSRVRFSCDYHSNNDFSCYEDHDFIGEADLTEYFTQLPFENYVILELCGKENCDYRTHYLVFM